MRIEMRAIDEVVPYENNPRNNEKAIPKVMASLQEFGFRQPIVVDARGVVIAGHTRLAAAKRLGLKEVPVHVADLSEPKARAYRLMDNRSHEDAEWNHEALLEELSEIDQYPIDLELTGFGRDELEGMFAPVYSSPADLDNVMPRSRGKRDCPVDIIFTINGASVFCCLACKAGWKYGVQSSEGMRLCLYHEDMQCHGLTFIDNDYHDYDHARHLELVAEHRPKYATVRDIMTRDQCRAAGIEFYPREKILDWAAELSEYAENVIVIPKYDCLDKVPEHFMLGYSIPSSHGGTPIPLQAFRGRRVHLLGGSWKRQRSALTELGSDVVSLDNNHLLRMAAIGSYVQANGVQMALGDLIPIEISNPVYTCLTLSVGYVAAEVNRIYDGSAVAEDETGEALEPLMATEHDLEAAE